ncbi:hypothetical protein GCM10010095_21740 [Streptomyces anthocyanicus]|nr:hypothetical protein GCM10010095_21740 [Streptomyces anthocyanicus]
MVSPAGRYGPSTSTRTLVAGASQHLTEAGVDNATAVMADGAAGLLEHAPYDWTIFTVGLGDVPVKNLDQLAPAGRPVMPMRIRGSICRSFAFERDGDAWKTVSCADRHLHPAAQGRLRRRLHLRAAGGEGNVRLETFSEQDVDRDALRTVLDQQQTEIPTGAEGSARAQRGSDCTRPACCPTVSPGCRAHAPDTPRTSGCVPWPPSTADPSRT